MNEREANCEKLWRRLMDAPPEGDEGEISDDQISKLWEHLIRCYPEIAPEGLQLYLVRCREYMMVDQDVSTFFRRFVGSTGYLLTELDAANARIAELEAENERAFDEEVQRQEADADLQNALDARDQWFEKYEAACSRIAELEGASDE